MRCDWVFQSLVKAVASVVRRRCLLNTMAAHAGVLDSLTRRHGIKIVSVGSVEECSLAVGNVIGHKSILAAPK